jgi:hypothetical protein
LLFMQHVGAWQFVDTWNTPITLHETSVERKKKKSNT